MLPELGISITIPPRALDEETRIGLTNGLNPSNFDLGADFPGSLVLDFAANDSGWKVNGAHSKFTYSRKTLPKFKLTLKKVSFASGNGSLRVSLKGAGHSFGAAQSRLVARLSLGDASCMATVYAGDQSQACTRTPDTLACK